jgi:hypothetical protein
MGYLMHSWIFVHLNDLLLTNSRRPGALNQRKPLRIWMQELRVDFSEKNVPFWEPFRM